MVIDISIRNVFLIVVFTVSIGSFMLIIFQFLFIIKFDNKQINGTRISILLKTISS
jgi:hypothetical protein